MLHGHPSGLACVPPTPTLVRPHHGNHTPGRLIWVRLPVSLSLQIERQLFEETVKTLNSFYAEAEKIGGSSYLEGCLACATAYFIFLCMETHYEKVAPPPQPHLPSPLGLRCLSLSLNGPLSSQVLKKISRYIQEQNEKVFAPRGLLLTDPVERGMRVVSFLAVPFEGTQLQPAGALGRLPVSWTTLGDSAQGFLRVPHIPGHRPSYPTIS